MKARKANSSKKSQGIAVILLGGKGERYGNKLPKQYIEMGGQPLFLYSYLTFHESKEIDAILLVVPKGRVKGTLKLLPTKDKLLGIIEGGACREESSAKAIKHLAERKADPYATVLIHDADRPLVSQKLIASVKSAARKNLFALPALPIDSSMAYAPSGERIEHYGDRTGNYLVQTPEAAAFSLYLRAFKHAEGRYQDFHDDASLVMSCIGGSPTIVRGEYSNIKINDVESAKFFETILRGMNK